MGESSTSIPSICMARLEAWFTAYVRGYRSGNRDLDANLALKEGHTNRVREEIVTIGKALCLEPAELALAEALALLHDVGRFEQYARYQTFRDTESENHAILGARVIHENGVLAEFDPPTRRLILDVVSCHNLARIPKRLDGDRLFFLRLLRDADKLDIWRVLTDYYHRKDATRNEAIELGLPDTPDISDEVLQDLASEKVARMEHVRTLSDFKVLQLGWVYDINFVPAFLAVRQRGYLDLIRDALPRSEKASTAYLSAKAHLERMCG